jgi:predicted PolB exonuclease-like 3'-5' exonuclease
MNILVFDIETIPDIETGRKLYSLDGLNDDETAKAMFALRRAKVGHDFLPHHLHKVVAISLILRTSQQFKVWSLGDESSSEKEIITRFFTGIDKHIPNLVSWNGSGFDLPVLHYRALLHGICCKTYWEIGEEQQNFRWNNYLNRFHYRHLDLMDVLATYQSKAYAPLDEIATMLDLPGKMGMHGSKVWQAYQDNQIKNIRDYCETDVLNTYCVYLRFEKMRGLLDDEGYLQAMQQVKDYLRQQTEAPHLFAFLEKLEA